MKMVSLAHKEVLVVSCSMWDTCAFGFCTRVKFSVLILKKKETPFCLDIACLRTMKGWSLEMAFGA